MKAQKHTASVGKPGVIKNYGLFLFMISMLMQSYIYAQGDIITTFAGQYNNPGFSGDNGSAINAQFNNPVGLCFDRLNNIYVVDASSNRVRKIDHNTGIITTVAGNGIRGSSGDNGPAINAELGPNIFTCTDPIGNIYIADYRNNIIRKVTGLTGIITIIAGNGISGDTGDGGLAINAELNGPEGICSDTAGNIYITDDYNYKIRKINTATGIISTIAGTGVNGYSGNDSLAVNARLSGLSGIFVDNQENIFISDYNNNVIRKINGKTGIISTIAGTGVAGYTGDGSLAVNARLWEPTGIFVNAQNDVFICDSRNEVVRKINGKTGIITTVAGNGTAGYSGDGGLATKAELYCVTISLDNNGNIFIADVNNQVIRKVTNPLLSISDRTIIKEQFEIYPNPAQNIANLDLNLVSSNDVNVSVYDFTGRIVYSHNEGTLDEGEHTLTVNTNSMPSGVYIYKVTAGTDVSSGKFTVVK